jgi:hypothetical protein
MRLYLITRLAPSEVLSYHEAYSLLRTAFSQALLLMASA